MLIRDTTTPTNPEQYYSDSVLNRPTVARSAYDNFAYELTAPIAAINLLNPMFASSPEGQQVRAMKDSLDIENQQASGAQELTNNIASLTGFALNPVNWIGGGAGGLVARGLEIGAEKFAPDAIMSLAKKPLSDFVSSDIGQKYLADKTLGGIAQKTLSAFSTGVGATIPSATLDNYNFDTNHIEWGGVAREAGEMGAFAIAIDSLPFAYGLLKGKINRGEELLPETAIDQGRIDSALKNGLITPQEHAWLTDYHVLRSTPDDMEKMTDVNQRASQIINENGQYANMATNDVPLEMISPKDIDSLKSAASDQMTSGLAEEYKTKLTDFIAHNSIDKIQDNQQMLDGIKGYVDHINKKLEAKPEKIAAANDILDKHLTKSVTENMPFSQKELMKMMKKSNFDVSHIEHMPLTIPQNLQKIIKLDNRIKQLKEKVRNFPNKQVDRRIDELESQKPKVLTPKEELNHLREKLTNRESTSRIDKMPEYHRLSELAQVWKNAKSLLDHVHIEEQYKKQEAFKNLCQEILKFSDSNVGRIAKPENVSAYLAERLNSKILQRPDLKSDEAQIESMRTVPADSETVMRDQTDAVNKVSGGELNKEFKQASAKFEEFKKSPSVFKNLMSCIVGGLRG